MAQERITPKQQEILEYIKETILMQKKTLKITIPFQPIFCQMLRPLC